VNKAIVSNHRVKSLAVIVPVLNEAHGLPSLLRRLKDLYADECLVVDGGSTDESCQILAGSGVRWLASKRGRGVQMNAGCKEIKSDIFLFIHGDTDLCVEHIDDLKAVMGDTKFVGGRFDVRLSGAHPAFRVIEFMMNLRSRLSGISTGDQAIFVRREVFDKVGGFPELPLMEDIAFSRLLKKQGEIACLRRKIVTSSRRWEKHGIVRTVLLMWRLRLLYWLGFSPDRLAAMYREAR